MKIHPKFKAISNSGWANTNVSLRVPNGSDVRMPKFQFVKSSLCDQLALAVFSKMKLFGVVAGVLALIMVNVLKHRL